MAALVTEHNTRVGAANEGPLATVRVLQSRRHALEEERDRLVSAIAMGKGAAKTLVHELEKREKELEEVSARIADAEERVLPVLVPSIARVKDFVTGDAALFTGDFDSDRKLLEQTVSCIRVYAIARGSAMECAAIVDARRVLAVVDEHEHKRATELLARIVAMLTKMCR